MTDQNQGRSTTAPIAPRGYAGAAFAAALWAALTLSACAASPLTVSPVVQFLPLNGAPVRVVATVKLDPPLQPGLGCAPVAWAWGDGCTSSRDSWAVEGEPCPERVTAEHFYTARGEYDVFALLRPEVGPAVLLNAIAIVKFCEEAR